MMKKLLVFIITLFIVSNVFSQGIEFEHGTFESALAKAKKENKLVFMDCYTTWCGPCKKLAKEIFPQKEVGDYFGDNFISVKMDMEKGEGVELAKKYQIGSYPTLLFLDANGVVIHRYSGFIGVDGLIQQAKIAVNPEKNSSSLDKKYESGERDHKFLITYLESLDRAGLTDKIIEIGKEFQAKVSDEELLTPDVITILKYVDVKHGERIYQYILDNKQKILALEGIGESELDAILSRSIEEYLFSFIEIKSLDEIKQEIEKCKKEYVSSYQLELELSLASEYFYGKNDYAGWFNYFKSMAEEKMPKDEALADDLYLTILYDLALVEEYKNVGLYKEGIAIGENLVKRNKNIPDYYYCLAYIYASDNNKEKALENADKYISKKQELGEKIGKDDLNIKEDIENKF